VLLLHVIASTRPPAGRAGLRGQPLRWVGTADAGGWATVWNSPDTRLKADDLLDHHAIVEAACALSPCLPVRFPTWVGDDATLAGLLSQRRADLEAAMQRVRDRVELAVTALWTDPEETTPSTPRERTGPATPGRRYLQERQSAWRARAERRQVGAAMARALDEELNALVADARHAVCPTARVALSSALLVPTGRAADVRERIVKLGTGWPGVQTIVNGPWPPYTFATIGEDDGLAPAP